jgi:hypothetical protein
LRRSGFRFDKHPVVKNPGFKPSPNQLAEGRERLDLSQKSCLVNAIKTFGDISIQDILGKLLNRNENRADGIVY